jgi:hypothetical protein
MTLEKESSCLGKVGFESYACAEKARARSRGKNDHIMIYRCNNCNKHHLGTSIVRRNNIKRKLLKHQEGKQNGRSSD